MAVASEEDGGLGTFAALQDDHNFDAALLPEPTALRVVCAQAGALTFKGVVKGKAAHAAERLAGISAVDRYMPLHAAFHDHERGVNTDVAHPLMRELPLPYPLLVGRVNAGEWSSMVPDRLEFEGRLGVPVGADLDEAREALQTRRRRRRRRLRAHAGPAGRSLPASPIPTIPGRRRSAAPSAPSSAARRPIAGVPWGADMRLFTAHGIPTVMVGTTDIELAHAVDESVSIDQLVTVARTIIRALS